METEDESVTAARWRDRTTELSLIRRRRALTRRERDEFGDLAFKLISASAAAARRQYAPVVDLGSPSGRVH